MLAVFSPFVQSVPRIGAQGWRAELLDEGKQPAAHFYLKARCISAISSDNLAWIPRIRCGVCAIHLLIGPVEARTLTIRALVRWQTRLRVK